ncbi:MAG: hypothetical protein ABIP12_05565 [Terriglobales bacterium]
MRNITRTIFAGILWFAPLVVAQETANPSVDAMRDCQIRVFFEKTVWDRPQHPEIGSFFEEEMQWWETNRHKFPQACRVFTRPSANFVVVWSSMERREARTPSNLAASDISQGGVPPTTPQSPKLSPDGVPSRGETYVIQRAKIQVFEVRDGQQLSKPLFKRQANNETKARFDANSLSLRFLTNSLFRQAFEAMSKPAKKKG